VFRPGSFFRILLLLAVSLKRILSTNRVLLSSMTSLAQDNFIATTILCGVIFGYSLLALLALWHRSSRIGAAPLLFGLCAAGCAALFALSASGTMILFFFEHMKLFLLIRSAFRYSSNDPVSVICVPQRRTRNSLYDLSEWYLGCHRGSLSFSGSRALHRL
jgi:hypothetical protein